MSRHSIPGDAHSFQPLQTADSHYLPRHMLPMLPLDALCPSSPD